MAINMISRTFCFFFGLIFATTDATSRLDIINGHRAKMEDFPYTVSIMNYITVQEALCGGAILDETTIVTTGRCVLYYELDTLKIGIGHSYILETTLVDVAEVYQHEEYAFTPPYKNDIAIIKLAKPLTLSKKVQPVKLPQVNQSTPEGGKGVITGWGTDADRIEHQLMQKLDVVVYADDDCENIWAPVTDENYPERSFATNRTIQICAKYPEEIEAGVCQGDAGNPLVVDGVLYGLVSYIKSPCGNSVYPIVFTKISAYVDWIIPKLG